MNFFEMQSRLQFKNADVFIIGHSILNLPIYAISFNFNACNTFIISASIHARENITTNLALLIAKRLDYHYVKLKNDKSMPNLVIIPMANPDGVSVCYNQVKYINSYWNNKVMRLCCNQSCKLFKANIRGVDLNNNFNAKFNTDPALKRKPSTSGFAGYFYESEPESRAVARLIRKIKPAFTISLHSKGEEIYYDFYLSARAKKRHKKVAKIFSKMLHYELVDKPTLSCGGVKDYCVNVLKMPSITIEVGPDCLTHPINEINLQELAVRFKDFEGALKLANEAIIANKKR